MVERDECVNRGSNLGLPRFEIGRRQLRNSLITLQPIEAFGFEGQSAISGKVGPLPASLRDKLHARRRGSRC